MELEKKGKKYILVKSNGNNNKSFSTESRRKKTETNVVERIVWVKFACVPPFDGEYSAISYQNGKYSSSSK